MDSDDPDQPGEDGFTSDRARRLFGTKAGARPWEAPRVQTENPVRPTSSAPYPRDATYTQRPQPDGEPVDDEGALTLLHPNYKLLMRIGAIIGALVLIAVAAVAEGILRMELGLPLGVILVPAALIALYIAIPWPSRRYFARGYQMSGDRLRVVRGVLFHSDTVVPFGRVQHIDVDQGPIERALGIATLTVHTAGSHNASVSLPGLGHDRAVEMRETIRAHIKRESV